MKVVTLIGTRPELIRLSRVIDALDNSVEHVLVHSGQNYDYELNEIFYEDLNIRKPDFFLDASCEDAIGTIANILGKTDELLKNLRPDAFLVLGDTNSALGAYAAKRQKIPIFHMEAGNRCFDMRTPEEINRKVVDHLSDIHLPYTRMARDYLIREGISPDQIVVTGSPLREVLNYYQPKISRSNIISELGLKEHRYFLVSLHREENIDDILKLEKWIEQLPKISETFDMDIVVSAHPRLRKRMESLNDKPDRERVRFMRPFRFTDYVSLQTKAYCVLSDSGTLAEEAAMLKFPALSLRSVTERPEGIEYGAMIMSTPDFNHMRLAIELAVSTAKDIAEVPDYKRTDVSSVIVKTILGYTGFVDRKVWFKSID